MPRQSAARSLSREDLKDAIDLVHNTINERFDSFDKRMDERQESLAEILEAWRAAEDRRFLGEQQRVSAEIRRVEDKVNTKTGWHWDLGTGVVTAAVGFVLRKIGL